MRRGKTLSRREQSTTSRKPAFGRLLFLCALAASGMQAGAADLPTQLQQPSSEYSTACPVSNPPATCTSDGLGAQAVVSSDLDGDGFADLIVANNESDNVSILYGLGDGTFSEPPINVATQFGPSSLAVADMNRDGRQDIIVAHDFDSSVAILLQGDSRESFSLAGSLGTGDGPEGLVVADLNGDGLVDAVTANYSDDSVSVLLGVGNGTFSGRTDYATSTHPFSGPFALAVADMNGDDVADLVVANADDSPSSVGVLLGVGDGTFMPPSIFRVGRDLGGPVSVAVGDLNGDHIPDVVTANEDDFTVSVLFGQGGGQLGKRSISKSEYPPRPLRSRTSISMVALTLP